MKRDPVASMSDEIVVRYNGGQSTRQIAKALSVGRTSICTVLQARSIVRRGRGNSYGYRKHNFDQRYFASVETPTQAYWLGFIAADGHVSQDGLNVTLKRSDQQHLLDLALDMGASASLVKVGTAARFDVYSMDLVNDLRSLGMMQAKSLNLKAPNILPSLNRHFIRGLFDGDGSIKITNRKKPRYIKVVTEHTVSFCGTESVLHYCRSVISEACDVSLPSLRCVGNLTHLEWGGRKQALRILDWLYLDADRFLLRKRDRWLSIPRIVE